MLDERSRRLVAAAEAVVLGFGGTTAAPVAGGLSGGTILRGITELKAADKPVRRLPPGTSKWNKIEHWLFYFVSLKWRGGALTSHP